MVNSNKGLRFTSAQEAILTTILYSDIFSFPLTRGELWNFLISKKKITQADFDAGLQNLKDVVFHDGYYCLKNRESIITARQKNLSEIEKKMKRAREVVTKLSAIPSIVFIGLSGGLAVGNAGKKDDIDLIIITKKGTLFTTRFLILNILQGLGVRRKRNQKETADTICVNLLFDEMAIGWFAEKNDVYTAREIAQIVPLFERDDMYRRFFHANNWIRQFLPNVVKRTVFLRKEESIDSLNRFLFTEAVSRIVQVQWMRRHQTKEIITNHLLAFHPNDYRILTGKRLRLKMRQFGLLTKF